MKTIAFTGHRKYPNKEEVADLLNSVLLRSLNKGIYRYISGLAQGIDQLAINLLDDLRVSYPVYIIGARPFPTHGCDKNGNYYSYYQKYLDKCDEIVLVSDGKYHVSKYHIRDRWMVDNANYIISMLDDRKKGGTYQTTQYTLKQNKKVLRINPDTLNWL